MDPNQPLYTPLLDTGMYLTATEAQRICDWLNSVFEAGVENYPRGAVGAALCCETFLLDSHRALTDSEIERILTVLWWEGVRQNAQTPRRKQRGLGTN